MRGPEEAMKTQAQTLASREGGSEGNEERDPCSSPPCKRLKQAVLSFQSNTSTSNGSPPPSTPSPPKLSNGIPREVIVIDDENRTSNCGGLVTAAPSPPEKGNLKPSSSAVESSTTKDEKNDEKQPDISYFAVPIDKLNDSPKSNNQEVLCSPKQTSPGNAKTPLRPTSAEKKKCKEEIQKMKEEKQKLKEEKERQRLEAKAQKEKEKQEAKQKKEQERLEKQAEKEKKEKERLEKKQKEEKEKQEKKEKKEEERRKKEEEINAKLEEKRKKEEEKKQQEEELKRKRQQASLSFKNFFTKSTNAPPKTLPKAVLKFEPFEIKPYMSLAPVVRAQLSKESEQKLDRLMQEQNEVTLYMKELQKRKPLPPYKKERRRTIASKSSSQKEPTEKNEKKEQKDAIEISDDETSDSESVVEVQQEEKKRMKVIFLKFHENNRPPYYGTQRKKSKKISPRNPLHKDEGVLNYEIDSDDEWEEEEPGESLSDDSDGDDDEAEDGEDEEEDGFMVPHGYLSDDEGIDADDEENEVDSASKEQQQLAKVKAWEAELKRKCKAKKPVCIGCVWPDHKDINEMLQQFEACILVDGPAIAIGTTSSTSVDSCSQSIRENIPATPDSVYKGGMYVPEEAMPDLITLIHRSTAGMAKLIDYFKQHWSKKCENTKAHPSLAGKGHISKRQLEVKIKAIAAKERRNDKPRWYVHGNILAIYGLTKLATMDNEQGMPIVVSSSPQMLNQGMKTFTKSVSPSVNQSQNALPQIISPHLQTSSSATQDKQQLIAASTQSANSSQVIQAENDRQSSVTIAKRRVVLQPVSKPDVEAVAAKQNLPILQGSSMGQGSQTQNDRQSSVTIAKRRVVLQPVSKPDVEAVAAKENLHNLHSSSMGQGSQVQSSVVPIAKRRVVLQPVSKPDVEAVAAKENLHNLHSSCMGQGSQAQDVQSLVVPIVKRRVVLQPVSKPDLGIVDAKENQLIQQGGSNGQTSKVESDKQSSLTPVCKQRVILQPIAKPDIGGISAKEYPPNPSPSGVEQCCDAVKVSNSFTATSMNTTIPTNNPEQDATTISPSDGLMKNSLGSAINITNSPCASPSDAGSLSSAVKRTAPSPVGTDRVAKVPRKSEESVEIRQDANRSVPTAEGIVDMTIRSLTQHPLDFSHHPKEAQELPRNSTSETNKQENWSKEMKECMLVMNNMGTNDGAQAMEIEQIIKA